MLTDNEPQRSTESRDELPPALRPPNPDWRRNYVCYHCQDTGKLLGYGWEEEDGNCTHCSRLYREPFPVTFPGQIAAEEAQIPVQTLPPIGEQSYGN